MSANAAIFNDLQVRNYSVVVRTYRIKTALAELSAHARRHFEIVLALKAIVKDLRAILITLHEPFVERLSPEQRVDLSQSMTKAYEGSTNIVRHLRTTDLGVWATFYSSALDSLERFTLELHAHVVCLKSEENAVLSLSTKDQDIFMRALETPPQPGERLRRAAERHLVWQVILRVLMDILSVL